MRMTMEEIKESNENFYVWVDFEDAGYAIVSVLSIFNDYEEQVFEERYCFNNEMEDDLLLMGFEKKEESGIIHWLK